MEKWNGKLKASKAGWKVKRRTTTTIFDENESQKLLKHRQTPDARREERREGKRRERGEGGERKVRCALKIRIETLTSEKLQRKAARQKPSHRKAARQSPNAAGLNLIADVFVVCDNSCDNSWLHHRCDVVGGCRGWRCCCSCWFFCWARLLWWLLS